MIACKCGRPIVPCLLDHGPQGALCDGWKHDLPGLDHSTTCNDGGRDGESFAVAFPAERQPGPRDVLEPCPTCDGSARLVHADVLIGGLLYDEFGCDACGSGFTVLQSSVQP